MTISESAAGERELRPRAPGPFFPWVRLVSWIELGLFAALLIVWLTPVLGDETFYFGLAHGIGFIVLAIMVWVAIMLREAPFWLLAATVTPLGPVGSTIGIELIKVRIDGDGGAAGGRGSARPAPSPARR